MPSVIPADSLKEIRKKGEDWNLFRTETLSDFLRFTIECELHDTWMKHPDIFSKAYDTIPEKMTAVKFGQELGKGFDTSQEHHECFVFEKYCGIQQYTIMRYKLRNSQYWYYVTSIPKSTEDLREFYMKKIHSYDQDVEVDRSKLIKLRDKLKENNYICGLKPLPLPRKKINQVVNGEVVVTRTTAVCNQVLASKAPLALFNSLNNQLQLGVLDKIVQLAKVKQLYNNENLNDDNASTIREMISFFQRHNMEFKNKTFINRLLNKNSKILSKDLASMNPKDHECFVSILVDIAQFICRKCTQSGEDSNQLLNLMLQSRKFATYALPSRENGTRSKNAFLKNPVVMTIKNAVNNFSLKQEEREHLVSLLVPSFPNQWILELFDSGKFGRTMIKNARKRAENFGPGVPLPLFAKKVWTRPGATDVERDSYTKEWFLSKENAECSPETKRDGSGKLLKKAQYYRKRNTHMGYKKYCQDCKDRDLKPYCLTKFYQLDAELGLVNAKSDAGLCPNCTKGKENFVKFRNFLKWLYPDQNGEKYKTAIASIEQFEHYFKRDGDFYWSLQQTHQCIDWCLRYLLSDPFEKCWQTCCSDDDTEEEKHRHVHSMRDPVVLKFEKFFEDTLQDTYVKINSKVVTLEYNGKEATVLKLRKGYLHLEYKDGAGIEKVRWDLVTSITKDQMDHLLAVDHLLSLRDMHKNFLRHLYLDRNQSYGELELVEIMMWVLSHDYMMKLRAKIFSSDTSKFHLLMVKGTSVHVCCLRGKITKQEVLDRLNNAAREKGLKYELNDTHIIWIDSCCQNGKQGGYETLCVLQATVEEGAKLLKDLSFDELCFVSDAGSGYKTAQAICGIRSFKKDFGVGVKHWHFNASGEGKRWETDGHNHIFKEWREQAMQAGEPYDCVTPEKEVLAQQFDGGIPGAYCYLLKIEDEAYTNEEEMILTPWKDIQKLHHFEFLPCGGIRCWRAYGKGKGKVYSKEALDKFYKRVKKSELCPGKDEFPQKKTGASFIQRPPKAKEPLQPIVHLNRKRKAEVQKEREQKKKKKLEKKVEDEKEKIKEAFFKAGNYCVCTSCQVAFQTEDKLKVHECSKADDTDGLDVESNNTTRMTVDFQPEETVEWTAENISMIPMGGGLSLHRGSGRTDPFVKKIVEDGVSVGNERKGSKNSAFEIHAKCVAQLSQFMIPDVQQINSMMQSAINGKKKKDTTIDSSKERLSKTEDEKHQDDACTLKHDQSKLKTDMDSRQLFLAKYLYICLIDGNKQIRKITNLKFDEIKGWVVIASACKPHQYDDRFQLIDKEEPAIEIPVDGKLSKMIKSYNEYYSKLN